MERPVASTTAESPPHGNSRASAAAQCRRKDSSMVGPRAWYFRRRLSMISGSLISRAERCEENLSSYFCQVLTYHIAHDRLAEEDRCDGIFSLITNVVALSERELLLASKRPPRIETRWRG